MRNRDIHPPRRPVRPAPCASPSPSPQPRHPFGQVAKLSRPLRPSPPRASAGSFIPLVPTIPSCRTSVLRQSPIHPTRTTLPPRDSRSVTPHSVLLLRLHLLLPPLSLSLSRACLLLPSSPFSFSSFLSPPLPLSLPRRWIPPPISLALRLVSTAFTTSLRALRDAACANVRVRPYVGVTCGFSAVFLPLSASTVAVRSPSYTILRAYTPHFHERSRDPQTTIASGVRRILSLVVNRRGGGSFRNLEKSYRPRRARACKRCSVYVYK